LPRSSGLTKDEALETLRMLGSLDSPLWLAGGIAADFHVGRWTREHDDVDLVTFDEHREPLTDELHTIGFAKTADDGWITRWTRCGRAVGEVSIAFMERAGADTGNLVIRPEGSRGGRINTGVYPGVAGNLDADRYGEVDGIRFRVVSPQDEWVFTKSFATMHPGAEPGDTDRHNVALLESVLDADELERLARLVGRRLPLENVDA
jgi:hypothetical protein